MIFRYLDRVPLTHFSYIEQKKFLACGPEVSVEFSAPPEFSGGVTEKYLSCAGLRIYVVVYHYVHLVWSQEPVQHCTYSGSFCSTLSYTVLTVARSDLAL